MATTKVLAQIPAGYVSPFHTVLMNERIDDALACVAMLTNQPLTAIKEQAFKFGLPKFGPAWVYNDLIAKLLYQYGLVASEEQEVNDMASISEVAILTVDWNEELQFGRSVLMHKVRGTDDQPAFNYVLDPGNWLDERHRITADFRHLQMIAPFRYIEVKPRSDTAMARKGK